MAATESFLPESVRTAALGQACQPVNPHAQRLQVAAHKHVRMLQMPKGKAKAKPKSTAKAAPKQKAKKTPKKKAAPKQKAKGSDDKSKRPKTAYGVAKTAYFAWHLGFQKSRQLKQVIRCTHNFGMCRHVPIQPEAARGLRKVVEG